MSSKRLILASGSPRRAELLSQVCIDFDVVVPDVDETPEPGESPEGYVERMARGERFDGIILDPPTAAAAGRRFWSVRKRQSKLISLCLHRLRSGGTLLACNNDHGSKESLYDTVSKVAAESRVRLSDLREAQPGKDFPRLPGFREGIAFDGVVATRD